MLISGRGSNLQAIVDAIREGQLGATVALVISNRPGAAGLTRAREAGIETVCIDHRAFRTSAEYERTLVAELRSRDVDLVCLAGFMRVLGRRVLDAFPHAILNVHPSLLPAFPGADAQYQAWRHGAKVTGATVHFVTAELDAGPIINQVPVAVLKHDTPETLAARVLVEEHRIYPEAIQAVLDGRARLEGRRVVRSE